LLPVPWATSSYFFKIWIYETKESTACHARHPRIHYQPSFLNKTYSAIKSKKQLKKQVNFVEACVTAKAQIDQDIATYVHGSLGAICGGIEIMGNTSSQNPLPDSSVYP